VLSRLTGDTTLVQTLIEHQRALGLRYSCCSSAPDPGVAHQPDPGLIIVGLVVLLVVVPTSDWGVGLRPCAEGQPIRDASALAGERLNTIQTVQAYARER
jgi:ATP-binding cassette subfamily B protein